MTILQGLDQLSTFLLLLMVYFALSAALRFKVLAGNLRNARSRWPAGAVDAVVGQLAALAHHRFSPEKARTEAESGQDAIRTSMKPLTTSSTSA